VKRVISVSLESSARDKKVDIRVAGHEVHIERIGTDGDLGCALEMIGELAPGADCIGIGGTDRYLVTSKRRYERREAAAMVRAAGNTPVADGSGFKQYVEPAVLRMLAENGTVAFAGKEALLVSAVDRFGMALELARLGARVTYGDLIFGLGLPIPVRSTQTIDILGALLLPFLCQVPISWLYPSGGSQKAPSTRTLKYFQRAEIIAGDFHFIRQHMPDDLGGKTVITNTTTESDVAALRQRGLQMLVTTTPAIQGRSFGTNVWEGVLVAISGKRPEQLREEDYLRFLHEAGWRPNVIVLNEG